MAHLPTKKPSPGGEGGPHKRWMRCSQRNNSSTVELTLYPNAILLEQFQKALSRKNHKFMRFAVFHAKSNRWKKQKSAERNGKHILIPQLQISVFRRNRYFSRMIRDRIGIRSDSTAQKPVFTQADDKIMFQSVQPRIDTKKTNSSSATT